MKKSIERP